MKESAPDVNEHLLANFRGFEEEISVRIRPITILIGRNSAGKSSLIKFLQMLRQTLESQRDEFFVTDGRYVQLGNWTNLKNSHCGKRTFNFSIDLETSDIPTAEVRNLWKNASDRGVITETVDQIRLSLDLAKSPVIRVSPVAKFNIYGRVRYARQFKFGRHAVTGDVDGFDIFNKSTRNLENTGFLRFSRRTDSLNDLIESVAAEQFLDRLRYEFTSIRHLSPVREESLRTVQAGNPPPRDIGDRGEYATPHMVQILADDSQQDKANFIARFASLVADLDEISFKSQIASLSTQVKARNKRTQAVSYLADFGFGVSQCLPLFIQGVMHDPHQLLLVEQPEAQLHPTARDVFDQMKHTWRGSREVLLAQLVRIVEEFIRSDKLAISPPLFYQDELRRRLIITLNMSRVVHHIWEAIQQENTERLTPVFDRDHPIRTTGDMRTWYTGKPCGRTRKSHINVCVYDSTWEASDAYVLDNAPSVAAWVKNDHLGFEILYVYRGVVRKYRPDFLVRLHNGDMLILETKGQDTEQDKVKRRYLDDWTQAVNAHGGFGRWREAVTRQPAEILDILMRNK